MILAEWCQIAGFLVDRHNFKVIFFFSGYFYGCSYNPLLALAAVIAFRKIVKDSTISIRVNFSGGGKFLF